MTPYSHTTVLFCSLSKGRGTEASELVFMKNNDKVTAIIRYYHSQLHSCGPELCVVLAATVVEFKYMH